MKSFTGCSASNAAGCAARYREWASDDVISLATCFWRQHAFFSLGAQEKHLFDLELPNAYSVDCQHRDWCGRSYRYAWQDDAVEVEVRTSIPGPLFRLDGTHLRLRTFTGSEWRDFEDLQSGQIIDSHGAEKINGGRLYYVSSDKVPALIICSQPLQRLDIITHRHYDMQFADAGAQVMVVPLLTEQDIPRDAEAQAAWLQMIEAPPLRVAESFELHDERLRIIGKADGASCISVSPLVSLLGSTDDLLNDISAGKTLVHTWCGPYVMIDSPTYSYDVAAGWLFAETAQGTALVGDTADGLGEIPEEMSYAGDATWEPGTVMDQFLSLRSWAGYLHNAPEKLQSDILVHLSLPTKQDFTDAVEIIDDHDGHGTWGRWRSMWAHNGDACYDIDWYNGLGLSGLARSAQSPIASLATAARALSAACKEQRKALFDYFVVFMDWMHHCPMTDPQGWMWNADCIHNGIEGIVAEAQLRSLEGDHEGAAFAYYIAARAGVSVRAAMELHDYHEQLSKNYFPAAMSYEFKRMVTWSQTDGITDRESAAVYGIQGLCGFANFTWCTGATRNPYVLAGHNPAWSSMLKNHWSSKGALLADWQDHESGRTKDWVSYYIGHDWEKRREQGDQEARVQAAVFYHLAPDLCFRYWTMDQDAAELEALFEVPVHLNEQIMLRSGCSLQQGAIDWGMPA